MKKKHFILITILFFSTVLISGCIRQRPAFESIYTFKFQIVEGIDSNESEYFVNSIKKRVELYFGFIQNEISIIEQEYLLIKLPFIDNFSTKHFIEYMINTPSFSIREQSTNSLEITEKELTEIEFYNINAKARAKEILKEALISRTDFANLAKEYSEDSGSKSDGGDLGWFQRGMMIPEFEKAVFEDLVIGQVTPELVTTDIGYHIIKKIDEKRDEQGEITEVMAGHILILTQSEEMIRQNKQWQYTGLTGNQVRRASVIFNSQTGEPEVFLEFNKEGAKLFGEITGRNINKPVALFIDNYPVSIPKVRERITSGEMVITGNFTKDEANELVARFNSGVINSQLKFSE